MRKKKISYRLSTLPPIPDDFMLSLAPANIEEAEETAEEVAEAGADRGGRERCCGVVDMVIITTLSPSVASSGRDGQPIR